MPWREMDAMGQRREFIELVLSRRWTMTEACERFGVSRVTGYKWWRRFRQEGPGGLRELPRAPRRCPHRTSREIEERLVALRRQHPKWGPVTLLSLLERSYPELSLPAPSTVGEIMKRHGLVRPRRRRRRPRHPGRPIVEVKGPNDVWTADFKGEFKTRDGRYCYPLTVADGHSRYLLGCRGLSSTATEGAKREFTGLFRQYGLPRQILTDNGVPFASPGLCGLSRLSVWWIKLGIQPVRIQPGRPWQNGSHERMHKTLKAEAVLPPQVNRREQQRKFDEFRQCFNTLRPHHAIGKKTPSEVYEASPRPFPERLPKFEYPAHFETRKVHPNACMRWRGSIVVVGRVLVGEHLGLEPFDDGVWSVYLGPVLLARLDERRKRLYT